MTAPTDERPPDTPPPEVEWVPIEPPPSFGNRSEPDNDDTDERGRPLGHWVAAGGSGAILGGVGLFNLFGPVGLAAGAVTAAGGAAAYGYYKARNGKTRSGFKMPRTRSRSTSRLGSVGKGGPKLGRGGKGPKLLGGKGAKLGGRGGPKLGKGGGPKLGGKTGKLLGGKGAKFGGGRGSGLGGKLGSSRKASTSRLGSVGAGGSRRRSSLLGRGGKAGLGLGARGGKLLGGKARKSTGQWSKSTGAGAGVLGSKFWRGAKTAGRKAGAAALRTRPGQKAAGGFKAAKAAMKSTAPGNGRWTAARKAARSKLGSPKNPFAVWAASVAAAFLALSAMAHDKWRARHDKNKPLGEDAAKTKPTDRATDPAWEDVIHDADPPKAKTDERKLLEFKLKKYEQWRREAAESFAKCQAEYGDLTPEDIAEHMKGQRRYEAQIAELRRQLGLPPAETTTPTNRRRSMDGGFPMATAAAEVNVAAAAYEPPDMWHVATDMKQMPDVFANVALGLRTYMQRLQGQYPIAPAIVEEVGELYSGLTQIAQRAQSLEAHFRAAHADDLKRGETPRTGEHHWNV